MIQATSISTKTNLPYQPSSAEYVLGEVKKHKFVSLGALTALIAALVIGGYFAFFATRTTTAINSLALLPFVNASNDANR